MYLLIEKWYIPLTMNIYMRYGTKTSAVYQVYRRPLSPIGVEG